MTDSSYPRREDFYSNGTFNGQAYDAAKHDWELQQMGPDFVPDAHYWDNGQGTLASYNTDSVSSEIPSKKELSLDEQLNEDVEKLKKEAQKELDRKINAKKEEYRLKKEQEEKKKRIEKRKQEIQKVLEKRKKDPVWQAICSATPTLVSSGKKQEAKILIQNYLSQHQTTK